MRVNKSISGLLSAAIAVAMLPAPVSAASVKWTSDTAYVSESQSYYETTLGGMHARRLYTYGLISGIDGEFSEKNLALDSQFTWPQLCVVLSKLADDVDMDVNIKVIPEEIPVWAKDAYLRVNHMGWITEEDVAERLSGDMLCAVLSRVLNGTEVVDTQAPIHVDAITRNDAFRLISAALDLKRMDTDESLHDWAVSNGKIQYRDEFQLPYELTVYSVSEEDAWQQIYECLDLTACRVHVKHVGDGDASYLEDIEQTISENHDGFSMDSEYDQRYLFGEYFRHYYTSCWAYMESDGRLTVRMPNGWFGNDVFVRADAKDWLRYYMTNEMADAYNSYVAKELEPLRDKSDYEKVCAVNRMICNRAWYDYGALRSSASNDDVCNAHSLFGYFSDGGIVCDGYADTAKLLLTELGVDCIEVIGTGAGEGHAWSKVYVDGAWYNVDFCWNDTCGSYTRYLLKSDKYMLRNEHTFDESYWSSTFYAAPEDYRK